MTILTSRALALLLLATIAVTGHAQQRPGLWGARLDEGFQHLTASRVAQASAIFDEVAAKARADGDAWSAAEARRGQARVLTANKDAKGAQAALEESLRMFQDIEDWRGVGLARSDLGFAAFQRNDWAGVEREYGAAAEAFERAGLRSEQANALRNQTFRAGPTPEKIEILERALVLAREGSDRRVEGLILHHAGDMHFNVGNLQGAQERYEAALPLLEVREDAAFAGLLTSLGRQHRIHGAPERALPYYERALAIQRAARFVDGMRQTEEAMALALAKLGRTREALEHAEAALKIAIDGGMTAAVVAVPRLRVAELAGGEGQYDRALELFGVEQLNPRLEVRRLMGRARVFLARVQLDAAIAEANAAVSHAATGTDWENTLNAVSIRGWIQEHRSRPDEALADALAAVQVVESVRTALVQSDDFRVAFSDGYRSVYDRAVELLTRAGRHQDAFDIAERGRARALLDLRAARLPRGTEIPATSSASLRDLAPDETLLAYWVTGTATYAWVANAGGVIHTGRVSFGSKELTSLVDAASGSGRLVSTLATRGGAQTVFKSDPRPLLRSLHDRLVAPLRSAFPQKAASRVIVVPDGPLLGLSFAELIGKDGRYLLEDYTLQYAPSLALASRPATSAATSLTSTLLVALSAGYPKAAGETLEPLPGARREVLALAKLFSPADATVVSEADATESRVRSAMTGRRVVHLATHAVVSGRTPAESFLALRAAGSDDGRLTAGEIIGMQINTDLVVLSACRSAAGQVTGEGMLGLSRAILAAGTRSLLASTRDVPDEMAADILPRFYASWKTSGDAAAALRAAQLEQLRRLRAGRVRVKSPFGEVTLPEHPSLWAGFVLIGQR